MVLLLQCYTFSAKAIRSLSWPCSSVFLVFSIFLTKMDVSSWRLDSNILVCSRAVSVEVILEV